MKDKRQFLENKRAIALAHYLKDTIRGVGKKSYIARLSRSKMVVRKMSAVRVTYLKKSLRIFGSLQKFCSRRLAESEKVNGVEKKLLKLAGASCHRSNQLPYFFWSDQ